MTDIDLVVDAHAIIGESPVWVAEENALYWTDIKAPCLFRTDFFTGETQRWQLSSDCGAYALDGAGRALVALRTGLYWLDLATGAETLAVPAPFDDRVIRFNEGICDSAGRFWVGTMTDPVDGGESDERGLLHSYTAGEGLVPHADLSFLVNGMAFSADEKTFYLSHSYAHEVFAFDYDIASGALSNRRAFIRMNPDDGIPDGAAIDAEGFYWCAMHGGGALHRYTPDGAFDRAVKLPVSQPTMCCFTGEDLGTLYVTSAAQKLTPEQLEAEPHAGGLFKLAPGVQGQPKHWRVA